MSELRKRCIYFYMTYRGIYRDGVVVLQGDVALQDGEAVEVNTAKPNRQPPATPNKKKLRSEAPQRRAGGKTAKKTRTRKSIQDLAAFGIWKDRAEWKGLSTLEIMAQLRTHSLGRGNTDGTPRGGSRARK